MSCEGWAGSLLHQGCQREFLFISDSISSITVSVLCLLADCMRSCYWRSQVSGPTHTYSFEALAGLRQNQILSVNPGFTGKLDIYSAWYGFGGVQGLSEEITGRYVPCPGLAPAPSLASGKALPLFSPLHSWRHNFFRCRDCFVGAWVPTQPHTIRP